MVCVSINEQQYRTSHKDQKVLNVEGRISKNALFITPYRSCVLRFLSEEGLSSLVAFQLYSLGRKKSRYVKRFCEGNLSYFLNVSVDKCIFTFFNVYFLFFILFYFIILSADENSNNYGYTYVNL